MKCSVVQSPAENDRSLHEPEPNMRRIKFRLLPGMLNCIHWQAPENEPHVTIRRLVCGQLAKLGDWNGGDIAKNWPPIQPPADQPVVPVNASAHPGVPRALTIEETITALNDRCGDINTTLSGIESVDADLKREVNEVAAVYLPAVVSYCWQLTDSLAGIADTNSNKFDIHALVARFLVEDVALGFESLAANNFPEAMSYLDKIGLIVPTTTVPEAMPWKYPLKLPDKPTIDQCSTNSTADYRVDVPFPKAAHARVELLIGPLALGKEKICFELLVSALAGISPKVHLRRMAEAAIMRRHRRVLSWIHSRVVKRYECCLNEEIDVPAHDQTLRPFLERIAITLKKLETNRQGVEMMLVSAEIARTGADDFEVLIGLTNRARRLAALKGKVIGFKSCQELAELLTALGIQPKICPSLPK